MCDTCWEYVVGEAPACAACVQEARGRPSRAWSLAVAAVLTAAALAFFASRHLSGDLAAGAALGAVLGAIGFAALVVARARSASAQAPPARRRDEDDAAVADPLAPGVHPYRARVARAVTRTLPRLSARSTALVVALSFVATGSLVPFAVRLPPWEKAEIVLACWWLVGAVTFAVLLYRDARLADDLLYRAPWERPTAEASAGGARGPSRDWSLGDPSGCVEGGEGCAGVVIGLLLAAAAFAAAWLVVELVAPLVFFLFYAVVLRAIARVLRDRHDCAGRVGRSVGWGALWAGVYVLPLAAAVLGLHAAMGGHAGASVPAP